jgi:hypothetical protein
MVSWFVADAIQFAGVVFGLVGIILYFDNSEFSHTVGRLERALFTAVLMCVIGVLAVLVQGGLTTSPGFPPALFFVIPILLFGVGFSVAVRVPRVSKVGNLTGNQLVALAVVCIVLCGMALFLPAVLGL